jgi:hypothetical protein
MSSLSDMGSLSLAKGGSATQEGKEMARWNATRHGIRSPAPVVPGVKLALEAGPAFPAEIADASGLALKTVKNVLSSLRKDGEVKDTGKTDGQSKQVSLVSSPLRNRDRRDTHGANEKCRALEPGIVRTLEECIHAEPGGCWFCRKSNEGGKQTFVGDNRGGIGKANREEHRR